MEKFKALHLGVNLERDAMRLILAGSGGTIYMDVPDVQNGGSKPKNP